MSLTLYGTAQNGRVQKVLAAGAFAGLKIELASGFQPGTTNKSDEYKHKLNPTGKVPTLLTPQGPVWESNAILRYIARLRPEAQLYGKTNMDNALVDQWLDFAAHEIEPSAFVWLFPILGVTTFNPKAYADAKAITLTNLQVLNDHLLHHTYLVGHHITIADLAVFAATRHLFARVLSPEVRQSHGNVTRWYQTIGHQPQVQAIYGEPALATQEEQAAGQDKAAGKKDKAAAKAPSTKAAPKEKAAPAAAAPAKNEAADLEDEIAKQAKAKPKSKLESLPPTNMDLDAYKRAAFAIRPINPNFFEEAHKETFDAQGYSWWTADYKYNNENQVFFMTGNLIGGFIQRCDAVRKYAMGVMVISGNPDEETPPFPVSGAFMFRGQEIPDEMLQDNPDSEYYEWKKVDVTTPQGLQQIKDLYYAETINGQAVLDRRFFK